MKGQSLLDYPNTVEYTNYQTKTTGAMKQRKELPLIAPKISFATLYSELPATPATTALIALGPKRGATYTRSRRP